LNPLLGRLLILAALGAATSGAVVAFAAGRRNSESGLVWARRLAALFSWALIGANAIMIKALLERDFTVKYVDQVGSVDVPDYIAVVSLWSALEGSILFWGLVLGGYILWFLRAMRGQHRDMQPYTIGSILVIGAFFALLISGPANPFVSVDPKAFHVGPNPLLQNHYLMIIHPPTLYLGYVGMAIPFSMGIAALLRGRLGASWMKPMRRFMLVPWGFLTAGIVLGGWWAYEVLGWGGYWAWDPVENASFLPWLSATAFLHAAMLQERRGILKGWTIVLLLITFALTILGTFMTRSGVFNSVHSFTQSPIGPMFLIFLAIVLVVSVILLSLRMHLMEPDGEFKSPVSRDAMFVLNNLFFVAFTFVVLIGTVFPLLAEAVRGVKISVGEPYFNLLSVPIGIAIVFLMGVGPALPWGRATPKEVQRALGMPTVAGLVALVVPIVAGWHNGWVLATWYVAGFAASVSLRDLWTPVAAVRARRGVSLGPAALEAFRRGRRRMGGQIVHLGVAMMAVSIATSGAFQSSKELVLDKGQTAEVGDYTLRFDGTDRYQEPHRSVVAAKIAVFQGDKQVNTLTPRMNRYTSQMAPIGTPAVHSRIGEDLYLSMMQVDNDDAFVGLRIFVNPLVSWLWVATAVMCLGCGIALWPARRKEVAVLDGPAPTENEEAAA
jgi:cytochrome c-type biogenesis protein CcmF